MQIEAFIIHLARATQRRTQVERLRESLPMPSHVVDAVDGQTLGDDEIAAVYRRHLHRPRYPFELRTGEIGCFLSHRKAWREIVERGLDAGLIIEDDVEVDIATVRRLIDAASGRFHAGDYIRFPQKLNETGRVVASGDGVSIIEPKQVGLGMVMQLVGRDAAAMLLEITERFDRPVDTTIQLRPSPRMRILSSTPVCVREISAAMGGSTIQKKAKPLTEIVSREVKRACYRLKLKARSQASGL
ncbi:glycosyl transferase [Mesorhizobium sp. Root157]|uniref:glycosyltransferase family 25 protein n=1 Tax=Mesorhizobium sp. Root157 TaxID=1736477 RepID=UPI0006F551C3|nr:glycosyltransferase family 25 protein [Mesorhizobium sp. Root157]KQZ87137.1 glycosyl transferase [Mesorhizobium sp. Root157]